MSVIKGIYLKQDDFVLDVPEMRVLDQGVTALMGPSGAGKSTLIRVLLGLEPAKGWSWRLGETEISPLPVSRRGFGVVFQTLELFPHLSAFENIYFPLRARGDLSEGARARVERLMKRLEISDLRERKPARLSGGERQRVAIARALSFSPRFVFLDEPFSSLDQDLRRSSRGLVSEILREEDVPALLVTHDPADVESLSQLTHVMKGGKLVG